MATRFRIDAVGDRDEAEVVAARNESKGYTNTIEEFSAMRYVATSIGGSSEVVEDPDGAAFLVIGRREE